MTPEEFNMLEKYMDKYHPKERLKYWSFDN